MKGTTKRSAGSGTDVSSVRKEDAEIIQRVQRLAGDKEWTMGQVTLAWTQQRVTSPVVGFSTVQRIDDALSARGKVLTSEEIEYLKEPYTPLKVEGHF